MSAHQCKIVRTHKPNISISTQLLVLFALIAGSVFAYTPALSGPFLLDDFHNLGTMSVGVSSLDDLREHLFAPVAGPTNRPVSRLSYLINDNGWPSDPASFKYTNLAIHIICGLLVIALAKQVFSLVTSQAQQTISWLALATGGVWLLHPLHMSTVMYPVQRMAQLSTLFVLLGCIGYLAMRARLHAYRFRTLFTLSVFTLASATLATLSKENGVLLFVLLVILDWLYENHGPKAAAPHPRRFLMWRRLALYAPSLLIIGYLAYWPRWEAGYTYREFDLGERLLTQLVILVDYSTRIFSFSTGGISVLHDDQRIYRSLFDLPAMLAAIFWMLLITAAWRLRHKYPLVTLGVGWFLGAHLIESTTVALELYFEHRNYLPSVGLFIAATGIAYEALKKLTPTARKLCTSLLVTIVLFSGFQTRSLAHSWGDPDALTLLMATEHPNSVRATRSLVQYMAQNLQLPQALDIIDDTFADHPADLSLPLMSLNMTCISGLPHRYKLQALANHASAMKLTDGVYPIAKSVSEKLERGLCAELKDEFNELLSKSHEFQPSVAAHKRHLTKLLRLNARMLQDSGQYEFARDNLHRAYEHNPSAGTAFELTRFWVRMGNPDSAIAWLDRVMEHEDQSRSWLRPDISHHYETQRKLLACAASANNTLQSDTETAVESCESKP